MQEGRAVQDQRTKGPALVVGRASFLKGRLVLY